MPTHRFAKLLLLAVGIPGHSAFGQNVNEFPRRTDPLHVKVDKFETLTRGNHWNEGTIMQRPIFPPAGIDRPVIGPHADCLDCTTELLAAYVHKYAIAKNPADRHIADQIFEGIEKLEKVTGTPGLVARSFYKSEVALWHEKELWYDEWHASTSMPGYRWLGDLSSDKFTSLCYGIGTYWEFCADADYRQRAADFLDRFMSRIIDHNFKLVDLDGKMTLWGNFCPDLPHQPLNSLEILMGLKVAHRLTGKDRFHYAYRLLIDRYHYDDEQIRAKVLWPVEWRNVGDDYHAARSLYMLLRYEQDPSLRIKYRMSLNRHWHDWQSMNFDWESSIWFIMVYQVLTGENVLTPERIQVIKAMWGYDRVKREFEIPTASGPKIVVAEEEGCAAAMLRNYWFGRFYGLIDAAW